MSLVDQAAPVREGEALDVDRLRAYLAPRLPEFAGPISVRQFPSGYSNLSYLLTAGGYEYVLRRPPSGTRPRSGHDMGREFRVLSALNAGFPECPRPVLYCDEESVLGAPFYLVARIRGLILRRDWPRELEATPALVRAQQCALIDTHARLHRVDYAALGLAELGHPQGFVARQVSGWTERYALARTPGVMDAGAVTGWLQANLPPETPHPALIHNDYKLDNVVFDADQPARLIGVLDWEMATIGDPLLDLGCSLAYWVEAGDAAELLATRMLPTHLAGSLTRREVIARYAAASGHEIGGFRCYRVFGLFRLAVIVQQIYYRFYRGQTRDERFRALGPMAGILIRQAAAEIAA